MNRQQKETAIADFREMFSKAQATFLVNYTGVTVASMQSLRRGLRENNAIFKVTKARLMKIAANDIDGIEDFRENLKNQVGLIFALGEVTVVAKKLVDFSKGSERFKIVSGFFESKVITDGQIKSLASLPSREVLLGMVAGALQAPIAGFANVLRMMLIQLLYTLNQVAQKKK